MQIRPVLAALGAAALSLVSLGQAMAADLGPYGPRGGPAFDQRPPMSIERWTGFYFGAGLGYASGTSDIDGSSGIFSLDQNGFLGSVFAGYNWQMGSTVAGLEADIGAGNLGGSGGFGASRVTTDLNMVGSVRGRLGFLLTPQALAYATAGVAWADYDLKATGGNTASNTFVGYQIGGGLEYMMAPQWTMRLEYVFTGLGSERIDQGPVINKYDLDYHTVRAGLAYKF